MITIKRAYDPPSSSDGTRVLVDRLWPRGVSKEKLKLDMWLKEVAPSAALRKWFSHDPKRWPEFQRRYTDELKNNATGWKPIAEAAHGHHVTLVYGSKDAEHNNAVVLQNFLSINPNPKPSLAGPKFRKLPTTSCVDPTPRK